MQESQKWRNCHLRPSGINPSMYESLVHTIFVVDFPSWRRFLTRWFCDRILSVTCKNLYMTYFPVNIIVYECFWGSVRLIMTLYQRIFICCIHFLLLLSRLDIRACDLTCLWRAVGRCLSTHKIFFFSFFFFLNFLISRKILYQVIHTSTRCPISICTNVQATCE